ncbi:hypothetical protein EP331_15615 [bacterium]|nr:MAG: hypothetical protein EP331_15615 [bacterium]
MIVEELEEFQNDLKKLLKKYKTLRDDLGVIQKVLHIEPDARPPFSFQIDNLGIESCIIKVRKIASKSFKGKGVQSGFRLIYAYFEKEQKIIFIEQYHKNTKENEDRERILKHFR